MTAATATYDIGSSSAPWRNIYGNVIGSCDRAGAKGTGTIPDYTDSNWSTLVNGLYSIQVPITGILATDNLHITPVLTISNEPVRVLQEDIWNNCCTAETYAGGVTFYFYEKPDLSLTFAWERLT